MARPKKESTEVAVPESEATSVEVTHKYDTAFSNVVHTGEGVITWRDGKATVSVSLVPKLREWGYID